MQTINHTDADFGLTIVRGSKGAARSLCAAARRAIKMPTRPEAEIHMLAEMTRQEFFGATCDPVRDAVCAILNDAFPGSIPSFGHAPQPDDEDALPDFDDTADETTLPITPYAATWTWTRTEGVHAYI